MCPALFFFLSPTRKSVSAIGQRNRVSGLSVNPSPFIVWVWFESTPQLHLHLRVWAVDLMISRCCLSGTMVMFLGFENLHEIARNTWTRFCFCSYVTGFRGTQRGLFVEDFTGDVFQCRHLSKQLNRSWLDLLLLKKTNTGRKESFLHSDPASPTAFQGSRTVKQLHYVNWPDHGVPDSIPPILQILDEMRASQGHDDAPICIHCRWGYSWLRWRLN